MNITKIVHEYNKIVSALTVGPISGVKEKYVLFQFFGSLYTSFRYADAIMISAKVVATNFKIERQNRLSFTNLPFSEGCFIVSLLRAYEDYLVVTNLQFPLQVMESPSAGTMV